MELFAGIVLFVVVIMAIPSCFDYWEIRNEMRDWNGGRCSVCGVPWIYSAMDPRDRRMYTCDCPRFIWIFWRSVDDYISDSDT